MAIQSPELKKRLELTVKPPEFEKFRTASGEAIITFECNIKTKDFGLNVDWCTFHIHLPFLGSKRPIEALHSKLDNHTSFPIPEGGFESRDYRALHMFTRPIDQAIRNYTLQKPEYNKLQKLLFPNIDPDVTSYFGDLLKDLLEAVGYIIIIKPPYFASPTSAAYFAPLFVAPLKKDFKPEIKDGYERVYTYFSYEKPHSKSQVQLRLLDEILEEKLENIELQLKENLSAYGLKVLYLILRECDHNGRQPWFELDTNTCLDLLGCKKTKRGVHDQRNRRRLSRELHALTNIKFNVVAEIPKGPKSKKFFKMNGNLISATEFGIYEAKENQTIENAKQIKDGIRIFVNPDMYLFIHEGYYTMFPDAFLAIDAGRREHAIRLYQYILNQWRIGWNQYHGVIKQPLQQMLEGSGASVGWPTRKNKQRDFVNKIIDHLEWLKRKNEFWIKQVHIEKANRSPVNPMITVVMAVDHPFKQSMTNIGKLKEKGSA